MGRPGAGRLGRTVARRVDVARHEMSVRRGLVGHRSVVAMGSRWDWGWGGWDWHVSRHGEGGPDRAGPVGGTRPEWVRPERDWLVDKAGAGATRVGVSSGQGWAGGVGLMRNERVWVVGSGRPGPSMRVGEMWSRYGKSARCEFGTAGCGTSGRYGRGLARLGLAGRYDRTPVGRDSGWHVGLARRGRNG